MKNIDFSKVTFGFYIDGKESYKTTLGGTLYSAMFIYLVYFTIDVILDLFSRNNFKSITINKILSTNPELNLNENMLNFGFSIVDENNNALLNEIKNRYFENKFSYITKTKESKNSKDIKLATCTKDDFLNTYNNESDFIKNKNYLNYDCIAKLNYTLDGSYNSKIFTYLEYSLSLNWNAIRQDNMTFQNNFMSKNKLKLIFKYFDYSIDLDDYYNPLRSYENEVFDFIDFNMIKYYNLDFSSNEFADDNHILLPNPKDKTFSMLDSVSNYFFLTFDRNPSLDDNQLLFKYYIRSSNNKIILKRTYTKIIETVSRISGLASNLLFFVILFTNFYNKFKSKEELINLLLKFKENFNKDERINRNIFDLDIIYQDRKSQGFLDKNDKINNKNYRILKHKKIKKFTPEKGRFSTQNSFEYNEINNSNAIKSNDFEDNEINNSNAIKSNDFEENEINNSNAIKSNDFEENEINNSNAIKSNDFEKNKINKLNTIKSNNFEENEIDKLNSIKSNNFKENEINKLNSIILINFEENEIDNSNPIKSNDFEENEVNKLNTIKSNDFEENEVNKLNTIKSNNFEENEINKLNTIKSNNFEENEIEVLEENDISIRIPYNNYHENDISDKNGKIDKCADNINSINLINEDSDQRNLYAEGNSCKEEIKSNNDIIKNKTLNQSISKSEYNYQIDISGDKYIEKNTSYIKNSNNDLSLDKIKNKEFNKNLFISLKLDSKMNLHENLYDDKAKKSKFEIINVKSKIFDFSIFEIICCPLFICKKKRQTWTKLYNKAVANINKNLNIHFYLKAIQETEMMKDILFSADERKVLNFISKPFISVKDIEDFNMRDTLKEDLVYEKNLDGVLKAYRNILNLEKIHDNGKKILKFVNFEMNGLIREEEDLI